MVLLLVAAEASAEAAVAADACLHVLPARGAARHHHDDLARLALLLVALAQELERIGHRAGH